jgi:hypothetical protein
MAKMSPEHDPFREILNGRFRLNRFTLFLYHPEKDHKSNKKDFPTRRRNPRAGKPGGG